MKVFRMILKKLESNTHGFLNRYLVWHTKQRALWDKGRLPEILVCVDNSFDIGKALARSCKVNFCGRLQCAVHNVDQRPALGCKLLAINKMRCKTDGVAGKNESSDPHYSFRQLHLSLSPAKVLFFLEYHKNVSFPILLPFQKRIFRQTVQPLLGLQVRVWHIDVNRGSFTTNDHFVLSQGVPTPACMSTHEGSLTLPCTPSFARIWRKCENPSRQTDWAALPCASRPCNR